MIQRHFYLFLETVLSHWANGFDLRRCGAENTGVKHLAQDFRVDEHTKYVCRVCIPKGDVTIGNVTRILVSGLNVDTLTTSAAIFLDFHSIYFPFLCANKDLSFISKGQQRKVLADKNQILIHATDG